MSSRRSPVGETEDSESRNRRNAFNITKKRYDQVAKYNQQHNTRPFLPRTLRREATRPRRATRLSTVLYRSVEPAVKWSSSVADLRCLWCGLRFFRFADAAELVAHLNVSHDMLSFTLDNDAVRAHGVVVNIRLQRNSRAICRGPPHDSQRTETVILHRRFRLPSLSPNAGGSRRPVRACRTSAASAARDPSLPRAPVDKDLDVDAPSVSDDHNDDDDDRVAPSARARARVSVGSGARMPGHRRSAAVPTVSRAAAEGRLFHSVVQHPLDVEWFAAYDSDQEEIEDERLWRLEIMCDEVGAYVDTISVEKIFMNLWNQFVVMEYSVQADKGVAPACVAFVHRYHAVMKKMQLEVSFLRHLTSIHAMGLVDCNIVHQCVTLLRDLEGVETPNDGQRRPFFFVERMLKQEKAASTSTE